MGPRLPVGRKEDIVRLSATHSNSEIAALLGTTQRSCERVLKLWRKHRVVEKPQSPLHGHPRKLSTLDIEYLEARLEHEPDMYISELREALSSGRGIDVCENTIKNALKQHGLTYKKLTRPALERSAARRAAYLLEISNFRPEMLVFLDESACNRHTARRTHGWAPVGDRARRHDFFVRGKHYSVLPAISLEGVYYLDILTCSWNAEEFCKYVEALLTVMQPYPMPNSVLIMDNASVHHFDGIRELVEARGCRLVYLPQYSPDLNPIEEGFSAMKAWIRAHHHHVLGEFMGDPGCDPYSLLFRAVHESMTPDNIRGWFYGCGYVASH